jgi:hypothetical protein
MIFGSPVSGMSYGLALSRGRTAPSTAPTTTPKTAVFDSPDYIGRISANLPKVFFR